MAVADHFTGFSPTIEFEPDSNVLDQRESKEYARVGRHVQDFVADLREDIDHGLQRLGSRFLQDPDQDDAVLLGIALVDGAISAASSTNTVVLKGDFRAEPGLGSPVASTVTIGAGDAAVKFDANVPGNGNNDYPGGNRILIFFNDPGTPGAALAARTDVIELDGLQYRAIVIDLATDGASAITTTANDIVGLADADMTDYVTPSAPGAGTSVVAATAEGVQMEDGVGGLYGVFVGHHDGTWIWKRVETWSDTAVTLEDIDGTAGYVANDIASVVVVANGVAFSATVLVTT